MAPGSFDGRHAGQQPGGGAQERRAERLHPRAADQQRQAGSVRCKAAQSTWGTHANSPEVNTLLRRCGTCVQMLLPIRLCVCAGDLPANAGAAAAASRRVSCTWPGPASARQHAANWRATSSEDAHRTKPSCRAASALPAGSAAASKASAAQETGTGQGLRIIRRTYGTKGEQCFMACPLCNSQHAAGCCWGMQGHLGEQSHEQCSPPM